MSIEEKRRAGFEADLKKKGAKPVHLTRWDCAEYVSPRIESQWIGWNAALDSVVIELPKSKSTHFSEEDGDYDYPLRAEGFNDAISEFRERIKSAGLKVKS